MVLKFYRQVTQYILNENKIFSLLKQRNNLNFMYIVNEYEYVMGCLNIHLQSITINSPVPKLFLTDLPTNVISYEWYVHYKWSPLRRKYKQHCIQHMNKILWYHKRELEEKNLWFGSKSKIGGAQREYVIKILWQLH